jgi:signal transduction histidine kinase
VALQRHLLTTIPPTPAHSWHHLLGEARTRIFLWYLLSLGLVFLSGVPAFHYLLFQQVDERVRRSIVEEVKTFQESLASEGQFPLPNGSSDRSPEASRPQEKLPNDRGASVPPSSQVHSRERLEAFFKNYLRYRVPKDNTFLITFINGEFYKSSPRALLKPLHQDSHLMRLWAKQQQSSQGEEVISDGADSKILYMVEAVQIAPQTRGTFVVAYATDEERAETWEAVRVVVEVSIALFLIALVLSWFAGGRILEPLRTMTTTAQAISETDLSQRLLVRGKGELANLAATFNDMMDRLEIAFGTQREFINDAGHELRTPITIIRGHLELMGSDPDEQRETLALVMSELERMSRLVDDMILLAKAERGDFLHLEVVDAAELSVNLFNKAKALADRDWQLDETARGKIIVDQERITESIMNLAQNATQHTQTGDTIAIGSTIAKGKVRFWVRDVGDGIPLADQKRIFERFARATNSHRRSEGSGLGLSIVRAIAEAHGGQILIRSKLGSGSMFTIILPLDPVQEVVNHVAYPYRRR